MGNQFISQEMIQSVVSANRHFQNTIAASARLSNLEKEMERSLHYMELENQEKLIKAQNKTNKLLEELKKSDMQTPDSLPKIILGKIYAVISICEHFENDYQDMLKHGFIKINQKGDGLETPYKKGFLYDYFKYISTDENIYWKFIEQLFGVKNMRSALGSREMLTEGMTKWAELKNIDKKTIEEKVLTLN